MKDKVQRLVIKKSPIKYTIRRSQRAKNTRIVVSAEKIEVVSPSAVSEREIHAFVQLKQDWIISAVDKVKANQQSIKKSAPEHYTDGALVPYKGNNVEIKIRTSSFNALQIEFKQHSFIVYLPIHINESEKSEVIRLALINWMKQQVLKEVKEIIQRHTKTYQLYPRSITIKTQKSRWGSCGIHNDININWLLILAPIEVLEYVVVHELCHIKERNHSDKFWKLVEVHLSDYQQHRRWLKKNGRSLMLGM